MKSWAYSSWWDHVEKGNNPAMLAKQTMTTPTSWPIRAGGGGTAQSIKDCATFPSPCGQPTGATEFRQHGGKRTAVATWQLTAVPTRQLTAVPTRQLTAEPTTRQLTAVPTRKLTAVLTRQLTMWPVGSATANFSHVLTACFLQQLIYFNVLTASTATADIPHYWQLQQQQLILSRRWPLHATTADFFQVLLTVAPHKITQITFSY